MLARFIAIASIAALAVAGPIARGGGGQCQTGQPTCCKGSMDGAEYNKMAQSKGLVTIALTVFKDVGLQCSGAAVAGSQGCTEQTMCCDKNHTDGVANLPCDQIL